MNRPKGHNYLTVFLDLIAKKVRLAAFRKPSFRWVDFAEGLLRHNGHPKSVLHLALDMCTAYAKQVRNSLGNAPVVYYKFHIIENRVKAGD